jgi:hypothetical protein
MLDFRRGGTDLFLNPLCGVSYGKPGIKKDPECLIELMDRLFLDLVAAKSHQIQTIHPRGMAVTGGIRRDILDNLGASSDDGKRAHVHKLVYGHQAAYDRLILNGHMSCKSSIVGKNAVVSHRTVMGDVRIGHKEITVSHAGGLAIASAGV